MTEADYSTATKLKDTSLQDLVLQMSLERKMQGVFKIDDEEDQFNSQAFPKPKEEQKADPEEKITFIDELDFYSIYAKS